MPKAAARPHVRDLHPVLMIFTSHRLDCLALCLKCLERFTDVERFRKIYIIANAVGLDHLMVAKSFCDHHENAELVTCTPRGLVPAVMETVNQIIARHPDELFMKMDEDLFVSPGWLDAMLQAHVDHLDNENVLYTAALCPVSTTGHRVFDPFMREHFPVHHRRYSGFKKHLNGNKFYHRAIWEAVVDGGLCETYKASITEPYRYDRHIIINCILYDRRMLDRIYPFATEPDPETGFGCVDELAFNRVFKNGSDDLCAALPTWPILHHYSHWRSEEYLRRHVPLHKVWAYFETLDEEDGVKAAGAA